MSIKSPTFTEALELHGCMWKGSGGLHGRSCAHAHCSVSEVSIKIWRVNRYLSFIDSYGCFAI